MNAKEVEKESGIVLGYLRGRLVFSAVNTHIARRKPSEYNLGQKDAVAAMLHEVDRDKPRSATFLHNLIAEQVEAHRQDWPVQLTATIAVLRELGWWESE